MASFCILHFYQCMIIQCHLMKYLARCSVKGEEFMFLWIHDNVQTSPCFWSRSWNLTSTCSVCDYDWPWERFVLWLCQMWLESSWNIAVMRAHKPVYLKMLVWKYCSDNVVNTIRIFKIKKKKMFKNGHLKFPVTGKHNHCIPSHGQIVFCCKQYIDIFLDLL